MQNDLRNYIKCRFFEKYLFFNIGELLSVFYIKYKDLTLIFNRGNFSF